MNHLRMAASLLLLMVTPALAQSDAKSIFEHLKSLNGTWQGKASN